MHCSPHHSAPLTLVQTSRPCRAQAMQLASQHLFSTKTIRNKIHRRFIPLSYHRLKNNKFYLPQKECRGQRFFIYTNIWRVNTKSNFLPVFQLQKKTQTQTERYQGLTNNGRNYSIPWCKQNKRHCPPCWYRNNRPGPGLHPNLHCTHAIGTRACALLCFRCLEKFLGIPHQPGLWLLRESHPPGR